MRIKADREMAEKIEALVDFALKAGGKMALQYVADFINTGIELIEDEVEEILGTDVEEGETDE